MFTHRWRFTLLAALLTLPVLTLSLQAGPALDDDDDKPEVILPPARAVRDNVGVFSPEARAKANSDIAEVRIRYKTDLVMETLKAPELPGVDRTDEKAVRAAYEKWLNKHAKEMLGNEGILVSYFPAEKKIFCLVGPLTQKKKVFSVASAAEIPGKVKSKLDGKHPDEVLGAAVASIRAALPLYKEPPVKTDSDSWFGTEPDDEEDLPAPEPVIHVTDNANIFSVPARVEANAVIKALHEKYKFDIVVESHGVALKDLEREFPAELKSNENDALTAWLKKHAKTPKGVTGFSIVFLPRLEPPLTFIWVGSDTFKAKNVKERKRVVSEVRRDVAKAANAKLKTKDFDGALQAALGKMQEDLVTHPVAVITPRSDAADRPPVARESRKGGVAPPAKPENASPPWVTYLLIGIGVFLLLWVVMAIFRGIANANRRNTAPPQGAPGYGGGQGAGYGGTPQQAQGGGFMRGFLGGLVGAAAGMWMYNSFFGNHSSSAFGGDQGGMGGTHSGDHMDGAATSSYDDPADESRRGDWGGGGADGGGDWGGGDAGGGDWGGGD